ncbi:MAG: NAD-dependent epimerase/dehydratase family protein [Methanosarcinales archaeon]|jgi:UDP-glucose 4-epimerase|nr:NAD-dependent epimerase/dehydratase family protein [Methanosarcinales archaeon]
MNILVTGGAGFIGSHIAEYFASAGHNVTILDNLSTGYSRNIPKSNNITFIEGDICAQATVTKAAKGADYVFHHAALVSVPLSCQKPADAFNINTLGTLNVLQASLDASVIKVIIASSAAVYGNNPILPKREDMLPEPASPYAISKLDCEYLAHMFYINHGLRTTCLRYFNVYGPRQDPNSTYAAAIPIFLSRAWAGEDLLIYGDGGQTRDFVHVLDVVRANVAAMEHGDGGVFNVATGASVTIRELAEMIVNTTGTGVGIVHEDKRVGDVRDSRADVEKIAGWWRSEIELAEGLK